MAAHAVLERGVEPRGAVERVLLVPPLVPHLDGLAEPA